MFSIAIDGPAGAGKSTISKKLAARFGFLHIDTGALYRAVGLYVYRQGKDTADSAQVIPLLSEIDIKLTHERGTQRVLLNGEDVSDAIRAPEMGMAASNVSAIPAVREFLFDLQQSIAKRHNVVMDGRDIGTVVLPNANVKIFLTASPETRAERRYNEFITAGRKVDFHSLVEEIKLRDYNDSNRETAPLRQANDALLVDSSGNSVEQTVEHIARLVEERM